MTTNNQPSTIVTYLFNQIDCWEFDSIILEYYSNRKDFNEYLKGLLRELWEGNPESIQDATVQEFIDFFLNTEDAIFIRKHLKEASKGQVTVDDDEDYFYEEKVPWKLTIDGKVIKVIQVYSEEGSFDEVDGEVEMCPDYHIETRKDEYGDLQELIEGLI